MPSVSSPRQLSVDEPQLPSADRARLVNPWLLSVALVWGLNAVPAKWLLTAMDPAGTLVFRFVSSGFLLAAADWYLNRRRRAPAPIPWGPMLLVGAWVGGQQLVFMYAFDWTTASEGSLLVSIAPVWTALLAVLLGLERVTPTNWLGIAIALAGVALIVFAGNGVRAHLPTRLQGDLLMILASLLYGSYMVYSQGVMRRYGSLRVMSWAFVTGSVVVVPAGWEQFAGADWAHFDLLLWGSLLYCSLVAGAYGFIVWYRTIARTTPAKTAVYQYLVPVVSVVASAVFLGERLTGLQVAGGAIALIGVALARRPA